MSLEAPFPWFGGKRDVAPQVWQALGRVSHYIEPFFGSGAVLLQCPHPAQFETVNDLDGFVANFWRAARLQPDAVAEAADWPCNEADLHARHLKLVAERGRITERLMGNADWCDPVLAGWWLWGSCNWIGSGWCSGRGPWIASEDGELVDSRQLPHLSSAQGINRQLPHLSSAQGINRQLPHLVYGARGIQRDEGLGRRRQFIADWIAAIADRMRDVRVACGDWTRVLGPSVRDAGGGVTGIFLDPPYAQAERAEVYSCETAVAHEVSAWCAEHGDEPDTRIVLAGYAGEHGALESLGWKAVPWKARGGYGSQGQGRGRENAARERLWLSPHCLGVAPDLFSHGAAA